MTAFDRIDSEPERERAVRVLSQRDLQGRHADAIGAAIREYDFRTPPHARRAFVDRFVPNGEA